MTGRVRRAYRRTMSAVAVAVAVTLGLRAGDGVTAEWALGIVAGALLVLSVFTELLAWATGGDER